MRDKLIITATTSDDMDLIISALSAYKHNAKYRELYERLQHQVQECAGKTANSTPLALTA